MKTIKSNKSARLRKGNMKPFQMIMFLFIWIYMFHANAQNDNIVYVNCDGKVFVFPAGYKLQEDTLYAITYHTLLNAYKVAVTLENKNETDKKKNEIISEFNNKIDMMNKQASNFKELEKDLNAQIEYYKSKSSACETRIFLEELLTQKYKDKYNKSKTLTVTFGITTGILAGALAYFIFR